jgi:hypothetical protein
MKSLRCASARRAHNLIHAASNVASATTENNALPTVPV